MFEWLKRRQLERERQADLNSGKYDQKPPRTPFQDMIARSGQRMAHDRRMEMLTAKAEEYRKQGRKVPDTSEIEARLYAWEEQKFQERKEQERRELAGYASGSGSGPEF